MGDTGHRAAITLVLVVVAASIVWVSVPFTDRGADCGSALGSAQHGVVVSLPLQLPPDQVGAAIGGVTAGVYRVVLYCQGPARLRIEESVGAVAVVAVVARRWRRRQPPHATPSA